jgi:hypothetical protein
VPPPRRRLVPDPRLDPRTVWERIATAGTRSHEAYAAGMSRLSCRFCVLSSRADLVCSARLNPDPADRYTEIERRIGHRFRAVDFQFDSTTDGRPIKIVSIIDEHTRECLGGMSSAASPVNTSPKSWTAWPASGVPCPRCCVVTTDPN